MSTARKAPHPTTIYAVSSGHYSDYRVHALFTYESDAEAFINEVAIYDGFVEEFSLDSGVTHYRKGEAKYQVVIHRDGTAFASHSYHEQDNKIGFRLQRNRQGSKDLVLIVNTWATSEKHAIKIANDKRAHLIAMRQWRMGVNSDK